MDTINNRLALQRSYQQLLQPYQPHFQFALTLTLKQRAKISTRLNDYGDEIFERWAGLNDATLDSTMRRFYARLTHYLYGNQSKHKNKQAWAKPLLITTIEGQNSAKRTHVHAALGNVPERYLHCVDKLVAQAWAECDFGYKEIAVKPIRCAQGWNNYMTKEVGYVNNDAVSVMHMYVPQIISQRI
jgi:hypothetical protein